MFPVCGVAWRRVAVVAALIVSLGGCSAPTGPAQAQAEGEEEVELAVLMGEMQRHSTKLGYSIAAQNQPLSEFYLEEVDEIVAELLEIEQHDGIEIAAAARIIVPTVIEELEGRLRTSDWDGSTSAYTALIDACNRCHAATEHEFIEILEPQGPPPYNQSFETRR